MVSIRHFFQKIFKNLTSPKLLNSSSYLAIKVSHGDLSKVIGIQCYIYNNKKSYNKIVFGHVSWYYSGVISWRYQVNTMVPVLP